MTAIRQEGRISVLVIWSYPSIQPSEPDLDRFGGLLRRIGVVERVHMLGCDAAPVLLAWLSLTRTPPCSWSCWLTAPPKSAAEGPTGSWSGERSNRWPTLWRRGREATVRRLACRRAGAWIERGFVRGPPRGPSDDLPRLWRPNSIYSNDKARFRPLFARDIVFPTFVRQWVMSWGTLAIDIWQAIAHSRRLLLAEDRAATAMTYQQEVGEWKGERDSCKTNNPTFLSGEW